MRSVDRPAALRAGLMILGGAALFVVLVVLGGANVEPPTVGLALAGVMLLYALRRLYVVAATLGRPEGSIEVGIGGASKAELRDEKRRLLRALKELEFDYGMGKLSKGDYESVSATYKMRAIEVMRALDGNADLHPEVVALLGGAPAEAATASDGKDDGEAEVAGESAEAAAAGGVACPKCQTHNDDDARFCKQCGTALEAA
ncbi:MAG: zinc ribbon domain-containing protein [Myxococcales bacterium]|nr:zinc ribbon domain-containing protein [Myxococcales bacterium]